MTDFRSLTKKSERIAAIGSELAGNPKWAVRGLLRIYENQTEDEKHVQETKHNNGIGFTGADARLLTSFAEQVLAGRTMSPKQMGILFNRMPKYAKQLEKVAAPPAGGEGA